MKQRITFFIFYLAATLAHSQIPSNDQNWQIVLNQNFTSETEFSNTFIRGWTGLNCLSHGISAGNATCVPELQIYRNQNVVLNNGKLELQVKKEQVYGKIIDYTPTDLPPDYIWCDGLPNYRQFNYTSGSIQSSQQWSYGYYEINCKLPLGKGFWPAFWIWGPADCGYGHEIDIFRTQWTAYGHSDPIRSK